MALITDYLATMAEPERHVIAHLYAVARRAVPDATEAWCYGMPALTYRDKGLIAIMVRKNFLSLYPFMAIERLGLDISGFSNTSGSIHFSVNTPISDALLHDIVTNRLQYIDRSLLRNRRETTHAS